ncbi:hypothetical protein ACLKOZ_15115 [Arthrobacter sp. R4]|uniref:hypothetical protein n=1 Tax=Arthrobacter sp. R4 TaxID=644417 RepID=UPI003EDA9794
MDHAGRRYFVVMSAALQSVVVTAGNRAGSPRAPKKPGHRFGSIAAQRRSAWRMGVVPAEGNLTPGRGLAGDAGLGPWGRGPVVM